MNKYWFVPKKYGYGLMPISWEGWLLTLGFVLVLILAGFSNHIFSPTVTLEDTARFVVDIIILSVLLRVIGAKKTKGDITWKWGG